MQPRLRAQTPPQENPPAETFTAPMGDVLLVDASAKEPFLLLDAGSEHGLAIGSIISVGGMGPSFSLWEITRVMPWSSRARRHSQSPDTAVHKGDPVFLVASPAQP
ncbi:MAG: hypothetical protein V1918_00570 [Planctomycetota bacterium]